MNAAPPFGPPTADPFARLVRELGELGFERCPPAQCPPGHTRYTATDCPVAVMVAPNDNPPHVLLYPAAPGDEGWRVRLDAALPEPTQILILYAVLNGDPQQAWHAAAMALRLDPPT